MSDINELQMIEVTQVILVKTCARTPNTFRKKNNLELHDYVQPVYTRTPFQYVRQNERFLHHMPDLSMRMRMMIMDERERERETVPFTTYRNNSPKFPVRPTTRAAALAHRPFKDRERT